MSNIREDPTFVVKPPEPQTHEDTSQSGETPQQTVKRLLSEMRTLYSSARDLMPPEEEEYLDYAISDLANADKALEDQRLSTPEPDPYEYI